MHITADMYTYTAGSTGLDAAMPPWVQEGGYRKWADRLRDPETRAKVLREMRKTPTTGKTSCCWPVRPTKCCSSNSKTTN